MKLRTVSTVKFTTRFEKNTYIRVVDTLDTNNGIYQVEAMDEFNLVVRNIKTNKQLVIKSTDDLTRYDFQVGSMQFVAANKEEKAEPTKAECERTTDEYDYGKKFTEALKNMFGNDVDVRVMGM